MGLRELIKTALENGGNTFCAKGTCAAPKPAAPAMPRPVTPKPAAQAGPRHNTLDDPWSDNHQVTVPKDSKGRNGLIDMYLNT